MLVRKGLFLQDISSDYTWYFESDLVASGRKFMFSKISGIAELDGDRK